MTHHNSSSTKKIKGVVYRPLNGLNSSFDNHKILYWIYIIANENKDGFLMGDFNIDLLKDSSSYFLNTTYSNNFFPVINRPTRATDNSTSLLDNIFY